MFPGTVKAWHRHFKQTDWACIVKGNAILGLATESGEVQKIFLGEQNPIMIKIPPGIWHGYKALGDKEAIIVYITNQNYDAKDELRKEHTAFGKDFWELEVK